MVANAMAIALRELSDRGTQQSAAFRVCRDFLAGTEYAEDPRHALAKQVRDRSIDEHHSVQLRQILLAQTCARLSISNPKHLAGHHAMLAASTPARSGE